MRREVPHSFRQGAAMAGAIFISNSQTRELCFRHGVFGLPLEYEPFVNNVKQGMPLFLFDYTDRKLFGVFEAASDGGLNINRAVFRSGYSYPAQVCFNIVWKCRPLWEDEFSHAIEENYYVSNKFYFDLSYQQVVRLYELFDKKRIEHPICKYSPRANLEREHSSKGRPDKRSLTPDISPVSADQSHTLIPSSTPKVSTVERNYSASTSMHPIAPPIFETAPSVFMPLVNEPSGVQFTPIPSSHHDQIKLPYHSNEHLDISTQVSAPCSQTTRYHRDQFVADQPYPLSCDFPYNSLSSGCMTQGPADGVRLSSKQSSAGCSLSISQVPTGGDRNYLCSTPYAPSYPQGNANWKDAYDIHCDQCKQIYSPEHQHLNKGRSLTPPKLIQQGIPAYHEVPEISAIGQQKKTFTDYIPLTDFAGDLENNRWKHGFNCNDSGSSGHGNDIGAYVSDQQYASHDLGAESNTKVPDQHRQSNVFSRISLKQQPPSQEITGPSLNQLLQSLSQRTSLWSRKNSILRDDVGKQLVGEQVMDRPCPPAELNLPSELEGEECTELPILNFKRRSKAVKLDANLGNEIIGKLKRRKLVRPFFWDNNNAVCSGTEVQGNGLTKDIKHSQVESDENKFNIDLNEPASVDSALVEEDRSTALFPSAVIKIQSEKPCDVNKKESNRSDAMEVLNKQAPSLDNSDTILLDLNVADLNTMDKSKLQAILGSSLLQALDKLRNGRSNNNNSEEAGSSISGKDSEGKMEMSSSESTRRRCNS